MARTFGGVSTDSVATGLTTHATQRTYSIWARRTGAGGGSLGSMFRKRTAAAADILQLFYDAGSGWYAFDNTWTTGGKWQMAAPSANDWHHIVVTYDASAAGNLPVMYLDGVSQAVGTVTGATGTINTNTDPFVVGNRTSDNLRNWAGDLGEFAVWDAILSAAERGALYFGSVGAPLQVNTANLKCYYPMDSGASPEPDLAGLQTAGTVTGTVFAPHPHNRRPEPTNRPVVYMRTNR